MVNAYNIGLDTPLPDGHPGRLRMERGNAFVARILAGGKPAELPVQTPNGFAMSINLRAVTSPSLRPSVRALWTALTLFRR